MTKQQLLEEVKFNSDGLVAVVAQDYHSKKVRMLAYMNKEALEKTLDTNKVYYYSRSRQELWLKGNTSGYYQYLKGISIDCDGDALLIQIEQVEGISCHTGNATCFYREVVENMDITINRGNIKKDNSTMMSLYETILDRKQNPKEGSYTNYLFTQGLNKILKKIGEETSEIIIASKDGNKEQIIFEIADLLYHLNVLMVEEDISWDDINFELEKRK